MSLVADKYALFMVTSLFQKEKKKVSSSYVETVFKSNSKFFWERHAWWGKGKTAIAHPLSACCLWKHATSWNETPLVCAMVLKGKMKMLVKIFNKPAPKNFLWSYFISLPTEKFKISYNTALCFGNKFNTLVVFMGESSKCPRMNTQP